MKITLAYKKEYLNLLSEEEIQKNKVFLEERYESLVENNPKIDVKEVFRYKFLHIELLDQECFEDGLYIRGKVLRRFKAKVETSSQAISYEVSSKVENY